MNRGPISATSASRDRRDQRVRKDLYRALAGHCRGRCLVLREAEDDFSEALRERGLKARFTGGDLPEESFKTAVLIDVLEHLPEGAGNRLLDRVANRLPPGGRIVVAVPNGDIRNTASDKNRFGRKSLRRLLKPLGKVRLATDQPLCWLVMIVIKPGSGIPAQSRTKRNRMRVTSRQCRGQVIELGCGEGHLAKTVSNRGLPVVGVDISAKKIAKAQSYYPDLTFLCADVLELELEEASFDTVVLAEILEHVPEKSGNAMLEKAWSLLRPGGRLVVSVPNEDCVPHRNHVRTFDSRSLRKLLRTMGRPRTVAEQPYKWLLMTVEKET